MPTTRKKNRSKPTTPSMRHYIKQNFSEITASEPKKSLLLPLKKTGGRNKTGKLTIRQRGGGHKQRMRIIDFKRRKWGVPAIVESIQYDPLRSAHIALLKYKDGEWAYIIAPAKIKVNQEIIAGEQVPPEIGNAMPLASMPTGTIIHNVELHPGRGASLIRSAGTSCQVVAHQDKYAVLKLPSGETRLVLGSCIATVGSVSNPNHASQVIGKAGRNRWLGKRPHVRGVAMNPVDHPMGGGEGKASGGHPRSRTGLYAKGKKTRKPKKYSDRLILKKRKK